MKKKALVVLAEGFEEVEAVTPIDILRRADVEVVIAGLGKPEVAGAHGIIIKADVIFEDYNETPDVVVLPGGMPGAENLAKSAKLNDLIIKMNIEKSLIAAICAAPAIVLAPTGILKNRSATSYPEFAESFPQNTKFVREKVVQDINIITSQGPATAMVFALKIVEALLGKAKRDAIARQTLFET